MLMESELRTLCVLLQLGFCDSNPASGCCQRWHSLPHIPCPRRGWGAEPFPHSSAFMSCSGIIPCVARREQQHPGDTRAPQLRAQDTLELWVTPGATLGTNPACTAPLLPSDISLILVLELPTTRTEFWWGERALAKFICNFDTKNLPPKTQGIMCYHLKREISSKWRSLKVPKVEKPSFVSWSTCSVQSARSTQVITFTTNGASHSDKMFQHYLITKLHYCSTTYRVKQFTCSIQRLSQMRKIYEYASKTAQTLQRRHHPE